MKKFNNIGAWLKRNVFIAPLKPRAVLLFSFTAIILACVPLLLLILLLNEWLGAQYFYNDIAEIPTSGIVLACALALVSLAVIIYSLVRIVKILITSYKTRKRAKKLKSLK